MVFKKTKLFIFFIFSLLVTTNTTKAVAPGDVDKKGQQIVVFLSGLETKLGTLSNDLKAQTGLSIEVVKAIIQVYGPETINFSELLSLKQNELSDNASKAIHSLVIEVLQIVFLAQLEQYRINKPVKTKMEENLNNKIDNYQSQIKALIASIRNKLNVSQPTTSPTSCRQTRITALMEKCNIGGIVSYLNITQTELVQKFKDAAIKALNLLTDQDLTTLEKLSDGTTFAKVKAATSMAKFATFAQEVACKLPSSIQSSWNQAKAIYCCAS